MDGDFSCFAPKTAKFRVIGCRDFAFVLWPSLQAVRAETLVDGLPRACRFLDVFGLCSGVHRWIGKPRRQVPQKVPKKISRTIRCTRKSIGQRSSAIKVEMMDQKIEIFLKI